MTKILLADDHDILFDGLINQCNAYFGAGNTNICTARSRTEALDILKTFSPDVLITDIAMEEKDSGLLLCQDVMMCSPYVKIVLFTQYDNPYNIWEAYQMGVRVFLDKVNLKADFHKAISAALQDEKFHTERVKAMILNYFQKYNGALPEGKIPKLTVGQTEYLKLFATGKTDDEIAELLNRTAEAANKRRKELYAVFGIDGNGKLKIALLIAKAKLLGYI